MPEKILIVDDQASAVAAQIRMMLEHDRYGVESRRGLPNASEESVEANPDLIMLVLPSAKRKAEQVLAEVERHATVTPLLIVVDEALAREPDLLPLTSEFLVTPLRKVEVLARVQQLLSRRKRRERARVKQKLTDAAGLAQLVGEAPSFAAVKLKIHQLAQCDLPVLITGETGTGKELCARALHYLSSRAAKPFLPVNCGAIPVDLFESEVFGREKGAYTGASSTQPGLVAEAEGGTLFLDEVETLSLSAQAKLLRFLEDHTYHALGSARQRHSDVRVLAATNVALPDKVRTGTFREDLYYRLAVLTVTLPPLRERPGDIPLLVALFLARYLSQHGGAAKQFSSEALAALNQHAWPGNVRELENVIQEVIVLTQTTIIQAADLRIRLPTASKAASVGSMKQAKARALDDFEKSYVSELLQTHGGNVTQAAHEAQKERRSFGRLVKKHQLPKS